MLNRARRWFERIRARHKIFSYDRRGQKANTLTERPSRVDVERTFDEFVLEFGGAKISDLIADKAAMPKNADYLFRSHNVIAELKTLSGVFSGEEAYAQVAEAFADASCTGSELSGFLWRGEGLPTAVQALAKKRIRRSIEQRVVNARKQLRQSKKDFGDKGTKLLILLAMDAEPLFGHRVMLGNLAKVMADRYSDEDTDGVVYFNPNIPTRLHPRGLELSGWYPFYRDDDVNDELSAFVNLLGDRWLKYFGRNVGGPNPILKLGTDAEVAEALDKIIK